MRLLLRRNAFHRDLEEEMRTHLEMKAAELRASGLVPEAARQAAQRELGNTTLFREQSRDAWGWTWLEAFPQDLRYAFRTLRKSPGFSTTAILTLALGIGANTAIFSVVNAVLIQPLPYSEPDRICTVWEYVRGMESRYPAIPVRARDFLDWKKENTVFSALAAITPQSFNLTGAGEPERLGGARVSSNFFSVLGVQPERGRGFLPEEDKPGRDDVVVISHGLWERRFASEPDLVGKTVSLDGLRYGVAGILPAKFLFPGSMHLNPHLPFAPRLDVWKPMAFTDEPHNLGNYDFGVVARLKPGVTLRQAESQTTVIAQRFSNQDYKGALSLGTRLFPIADAFAAKWRQGLLILLAAVGVFLLIACVNLANLLLARASGRVREFATRLAIGASKGRLIRQLLTESLVIAAAGGAAGLLFAQVGTRLLIALAPADIPRLGEAGISAPVLLFVIVVSIATGLAFGLFPAMRIFRTSLDENLKGASRGSTEAVGRIGARRLLVTLEVALSTGLLIAGALLLHSFVNLMGVDPGFAVQRILTADLALPPLQYRDAAQRIAFFHALLRRVDALPGVVSAGAVSALPLSSESDTNVIWRDGDRDPQVAGHPLTVMMSTTPGYLETMEIALCAGRFFQENEPTPAVVISASLAHTLWPDRAPSRVIGEHIRTGGPTGRKLTVVGVVNEIHNSGLDRAAISQAYNQFSANPSSEMRLAIRTEGNPRMLASAVRETVWSLDRNLPVPKMQTMRQIVSASVSQPRFEMLLIVLFAVLALTLAAIGIYGVASYSVTRRVREIGLRIALGAVPREVLALIMRQGLAPVLVGLVLGAIGAVAIAFILRSLLFGVAPLDPLALIVVVAVLLVTGALACYLPARRASRIDPMEALRHE